MTRLAMGEKQRTFSTILFGTRILFCRLHLFTHSIYFNILIKMILIKVISSADVTSGALPVALYELGPDNLISLDDSKDSSVAPEERRLSINEMIIQQGLARISKTAARKLYGAEKTVLLSKLKIAQAEALRSHVNLFRYGDPGDSDDEDRKGR